MVASTNSEQDDSDLVGKLDSLEGLSTFGSSPLNVDLLSELSKRRGFKLASLNIIIVFPAIIYMNSKCIDILAVNESRLDHTISSGEVTVSGYVLEGKDRTEMEGVSPSISGILSVMNVYLISSAIGNQTQG